MNGYQPEKPTCKQCEDYRKCSYLHHMNRDVHNTPCEYFKPKTPTSGSNIQKNSQKKYCKDCGLYEDCLAKREIACGMFVPKVGGIFKEDPLKEYSVYSDFDIEEHKKHFVHYLEVVIYPDGTIEYAVPSHQEKAIEIACEIHSISRKELNDMCPVEYYCDFMTWLCKITGIISVWEYQYVGEALTNQQRESLRKLKDANLYLGEL